MVDSPLALQPRAWRAARLSIDFVLEVAKISRGEGDLLDPLLLTAILEANQAAVRRDPQLMQFYADAPTALPDDLRRPISVNALAKSLRLPFETVRRRLRAFLAAGLCVRRFDGVYVPHAVVTSPAYLATQAARVERLACFHQDLAGAGLAPPAEPGAAPLADNVRAADRLLAEYMLRTCDGLIEVADGPVSGFVLLGLCALNLERLPAGEIGEVGEMAGAAQPGSVAGIAGRLGMPAETVRRRLLALQARGLAARRADGWMAAAPAPLQAAVGQLVVDNEANLRRLFTRLAELNQPAGAGAAPPGRNCLG